jgi:AcrR family transcriptional regulator
MAKRKDPLARQGYHHGNLREALVEAARTLIAERGPAGFTLVEAARRAGVSAAAPYRHFKDRAALIAEVAQRGFKEFAARLQQAWSASDGPADARFAQMGDAYLAFAREQPGFYAAMFAAGGHTTAPPDGSGNTAFGALQRALGGVAPEAAGGPDGRRLALQVWALSHGIATLSGGGLLPRGAPELQPQALLRTGVAALLGRSEESTQSATAPLKARRRAAP